MPAGQADGATRRLRLVGPLPSGAVSGNRVPDECVRDEIKELTPCAETPYATQIEVVVDLPVRLLRCQRREPTGRTAVTSYISAPRTKERVTVLVRAPKLRSGTPG
jgi:hypothetical protein